MAAGWPQEAGEHALDDVRLVADTAAELPHRRRAELRPLPSIWRHRAGNPVQNVADQAFLRGAVRAWLER